MTIKQFFQLAGGALVGLLIYALPLPSIIRWPLVIIAVISGAAFAFLPVQDRPLEEWLRAFFRAIYSPTIFNWQKAAAAPDYFTEENSPALAQQPIAQQKATFLDNLEETEKSFLSRVGGLFGQSKGAMSQPTVPVPIPVAATPTLTPPRPTSAAPVAAPRPIVYQSAQAAPQVKYAPPPQPLSATPMAAQTQTTTPAHPVVKIPTLENIRVATPQQKTEQPAANLNPAAKQTEEEVKPAPISSTLNPEPAVDGTAAPSQAQFSAEALPPAVPSQANIVVGQVMDSNGKIIEGALLEIRDKQGRPARALKTNKAGHFSIVTPLANNSYTIITEKDGYQFTPITFNATGGVIPPIAIKANNSINQ